MNRTSNRTSTAPSRVTPERLRASKTYQHELVKRLWDAQLSGASAKHRRLMAEAAAELESHLPATDKFIQQMRKGHSTVLRGKP